jgi:hypothetical protein
MGIQGLAFGISHLSPQISQALGSELATNPDAAREISQLSQFCDSDEKNETEVCNQEPDERTDLNKRDGSEKLTQLANQPDTVSSPASVVTNPLPNQSLNLANATAAPSEATANNVPSPRALAIQILQCQTWVAAVEAIDNVSVAIDKKRVVVFNSLLKHLCLEQRQHLVHLLAAHMQQEPQDSDAYSWLPQSSHQLKLKALAQASASGTNALSE